jgi:hypothetical protein
LGHPDSRLAPLLGRHVTLGTILALLALTMFALIACGIEGIGLVDPRPYDLRLNAELNGHARRGPFLGPS